MEPEEKGSLNSCRKPERMGLRLRLDKQKGNMGQKDQENLDKGSGGG